jgi:hypothetical protein
VFIRENPWQKTSTDVFCNGSMFISLIVMRGL